MKNSVIFSLCLLLAGCSIAAPEGPASTSETGSIQPGTPEVVVEQADAQPDDSIASGDARSPISIASLINHDFDGRDLRLGDVLASNEAYTRYYITYKSGALTISGIMNVPRGTGPFPVLILNHGHIDTSIYTNGRGLKREQDYLARRGYVVLHTDYRNHAQSDKDTRDQLAVRVSYVEDSINAALAVRNSGLAAIDPERIGMLGHSMGGGISLNALVAEPDLVDAVVLFAPVTANYLDSYERWMSRRPESISELDEQYGSPESNPAFWQGLNGEALFDRIEAPVMFHHGTADDSVPLSWSDETVSLLEAAGVDTSYHIYDGEPHEFINAWPLVMKRTVDFFDKYLKSGDTLIQ